MMPCSQRILVENHRYRPSVLVGTALNPTVEEETGYMQLVPLPQWLALFWCCYVLDISLDDASLQKFM